jgi:two-component system, NarL family, response regulator DevR
MAPDSNLKVFLVDDHELVRRGFASLLRDSEEFDVVGEASSAAATIEGIETSRPDVAVLDVKLPDGDGVALCREIRSRFPDVRCLILTAYEDEESLFAAIMAGASGYLLKNAGGDELVEAVRTVGGGMSMLDPSVTAQVLERLRKGPDEPVEDERLSRLTPQERKILMLIADGLTNREIAQQIFLAEATVKNYVSSLLAKLGMHGRTQAAIFATELRHKQGD